MNPLANAEKTWQLFDGAIIGDLREPHKEDIEKKILADSIDRIPPLLDKALKNEEAVNMNPVANAKKTWQLSDGTITEDFWEWHKDNMKRRPWAENIERDSSSLDRLFERLELKEPVANAKKTWQLSDGTITEDFWEWHKDNMKRRPWAENIERDSSSLDRLFERLELKENDNLNLLNKSIWKCKHDWEWKDIPPADSINYNSWTIEKETAKAGQLFKLKYVLRTESRHSGQYDGFGVYEINREEKKVSKSYFCTFQVYKPKENQQMWQEEFVISLKKAMPKIKLLDLTKGKESRYLVLDVQNVKLEEICNFFVEKGDIPKKDILNYLQWQASEEEKLII